MEQEITKTRVTKTGKHTQITSLITAHLKKKEDVDTTKVELFVIKKSDFQLSGVTAPSDRSGEKNPKGEDAVVVLQLVGSERGWAVVHVDVFNATCHMFWTFVNLSF